jgi:hypothetical protein
MSPAAQRAASYAASVDVQLEVDGVREISMTRATTTIWGTSGTGNPTAVRIVEAVAGYGYLAIRRHGKRARFVSRTDKPIPPEAMSPKDRELTRQTVMRRNANG